MTRLDCPPLEELALGGLDGSERAATLAHVARCADCRNDLEALNRVVDDLVAATPSAEPPPGLEDRVLARARVAPRSIVARRPARVALTAVAIVVLLVVGGVAIGVAGHDDRPTTTSATMRTPTGQVAGEVTLAGNPAGVLVAVPAWDGWQNGAYDLRVVLDDGTTRGGRVVLDDGYAGYGLGDVAIGRVRRIELRDADGRLRCSAQL